MTVEAFGLALPEVAAATMIWRRMFLEENQFAQDVLILYERASGETLVMQATAKNSLPPGTAPGPGLAPGGDDA